MTAQPMITLNDGRTMPQLGFGVWKISDEETAKVIQSAIKIGYRSIDTAAIYKNEIGTGEGIRTCGVDRKDLYIATKLWNTCHGYDEALRAFDDSMSRLGLDYLDLYLIHWPVAGSEKYIDAWRALVKLREDGRVRSIGVSNFLPHHIDRVIEATGVTPAINQIELHPLFQQPQLCADIKSRGVLTECWSPLGRGEGVKIPEIIELGKKYGKSPAQIIIRWHLDQGFMVIPKSVTPQRLADNFNVFDFKLAPEDMAAIAKLNQDARMGLDPMVFTGLDMPL